MLDYNLTQRERQILLQLLALSKHSKDHFEARILHPEAAEGPARELARLDFGGDGLSMELTKRDLRVLKDEGLIHFRWDLPDRGNLAERGLRFLVIMRKICFGTRSAAGSESHGVLASLLQTAKLQGKNGIQFLVSLLTKPPADAQAVLFTNGP